jgi:hypothetical protein
VVVDRRAPRLLLVALVEIIFLRSSAASAGFAPPAILAAPPSAASSATSKSVAVVTPTHPLDGLPLSERLAHMLRDGRTWLIMLSFTIFTCMNAVNNYSSLFLVSLGACLRTRHRVATSFLPEYRGVAYLTVSLLISSAREPKS